MKKGILCILLSLLLVTPLFTACGDQTSTPTETEANIYTLYTIVDDTTTDEAINKVELALNRILFYRVGVILKLEAVTEAEYDQLITNKLAEVEEYELAKKNGKTTASSVAEGEVTEVMTGDKILDNLAEGKDIELKEPSIDIFLVKGYDKYYELATDGKLAQLDEVLDTSIKSSIHSTLLTAAKVGGKTYGVPVNNAIGEYTYLVFDKELLDEYKIDPNTIKTIEDLEEYLSLIKQNEPDVVPLKNTKLDTDIKFLVNDGFPALVNTNNEVVDAYSNKNFKEYLAMIARYKALGYIADGNTDEVAEDNTRYAVRIETGTTDSISASLSDTGREYTYSLYSAPIATNETTIDNIFCVSKYVTSGDLTNVMKILSAINSDADIMNILTYGVENEHYVLTDKGQVERLNDEYMIDPNHVGNCFITYTLEGENPDKWNNAIKQNQDAIISPSLGFTMTPTSFTYTEVVDGVETDVVISEPDYISVVNEIVDKYYPALVNGTAVEFDYQTLVTEATAEVTAELTDKLNALYVDNVLMPMLNEEVRADVEAARSEAIRSTAETAVRADYLKKAKTALNKSLTEEYKLLYPTESADEIKVRVEATLTDAYVEENLNSVYTEEEIKATIDEVYESLLESEISAEANKIVGTANYEAKYAAILASADYQADLQNMLTYDAPNKINDKVDEKINELISVYTDTMIAEMNTAIEAAVEAFITENGTVLKEKLNLEREDILVELGYLKKQTATEDAGDDSGDASDETSSETSDEVSSGEESTDASTDESVNVSTEESADESTEESTEVTESEVSDTASDAETSEGETSGDDENGEGDGEAEVTIVEKYTSWFEFVIKEKITLTYNTLNGITTAA